MMFDNVLNRKQGFLAYKNVTTIICTMEKINLFSKGLTQDFGQKIEISTKFFFFFCRVLFFVDSVLARKEGFLTHKNVINKV